MFTVLEHGLSGHYEELPPWGCSELSRPGEGGVFWSKASLQSLPDGMQEYKVTWQIPVSHGQFLQRHEPS